MDAPDEWSSPGRKAGNRTRLIDRLATIYPCWDELEEAAHPARRSASHRPNKNSVTLLGVRPETCAISSESPGST